MIEQDDDGFGWILTLKKDEKEKRNCCFCGKLLTTGFWCENKKDLRCKDCQDEKKMHYCKSIFDYEHRHLLISKIIIKS